MVGDALGDLKAAEENEALYYPIMVRKEKKNHGLDFLKRL